MDKGGTMSGYKQSATTVRDEAIEKMVADGIAKAWENPRTGKVRYYVNADGLGKLIGLEVSYYASGSCSGCAYADERNERVSVAHSRAWSPAFSKLFIEGGTVYSNWNPYDANIAELAALRANEVFGGIDPDGGEFEDRYRVTCDLEECMCYDFATEGEASEKLAELAEKWLDRGYRVAHVRIGSVTGRVSEI